MDSKKYDREYPGERNDSFVIRRLLHYLRPYRKWLILAVGLLLASKMMEASIPFFIGKLTQLIFNHPAQDGMQYTVFKEGCFILVLLACCYLLDCINVSIKTRIGQKGLYHLRMDVYGHVIRMPLAHFDRTSVGRLMTRTVHDVEQINQMFADSVIPILGNCFLFAGIFVALFLMDWRIACLVLGILPFVWLLTHRFRKFQRRCFDRTKTVASTMNTFIQEHLAGASIIRNFGLHAQATKQFEEINEDFCKAHLASVHHFSFFIAGIDFIQNVSLVLVFVLIMAFSPFHDGFDVGTYLSFSLYSLMFFRPLADLAERYNVLQSAISSASGIFHLLDGQTEHLKDEALVELSEIESIVFDDVWFYYEDQNWVLKGLSLEIHKGHSYAIVGMTGEGKSTIINLLLRFYEPKKGKIKVNGLDISSYSLSSLRHQFSLVLQDPVIFSGTLAENISLFNETIERQLIENTVDELGMRPLVMKFPEGLDHKLYGQSKGLSAGEMQLISLGRAVLHGRSVLVLDEATANIDTLTERLMQQAIHTILEKQTAIVIAHRLSTIKNARHILVLQGGKIVETGNHQSLLEKKGVYEKLYRLQYAYS